MLAVSGLCYGVAGRAILTNLNLAVARCEIHVLLGSNGAGKTTLARVVMGCAGYAPSAGEIRFADTVINGLALHERARLGITMAWQEPARFEGLQVRDFLLLGNRHADAAGCLERVGLQPAAYLERAVDKTLSGGERKRIELASILALQPKLAILDEPASGIDLLSIGEIADVIQALKHGGASLLLITHRDEMAGIADRASYLCGGQILSTGAPDMIAQQYKARGCIVCDGATCR